MTDRDERRENARFEVFSLEGKSAAELAAQAREEYAYALDIARGDRQLQLFWLTRSATLAGLASYQAVVENLGVQPAESEAE